MSVTAAQGKTKVGAPLRQTYAGEAKPWVGRLDTGASQKAELRLAQEKMPKAAEQTIGQCYHFNDRRAGSCYDIWLHNRNRQGQGKLHGRWYPEPHTILATVADLGLVCKVKLERGPKDGVLLRNSFRLCTHSLP